MKANRQTNGSVQKPATGIANKIISIALNVYNLPLFKELRYGSEPYVTYGNNNTYPDYLIDMFNQCAVHNAIITSKVNYITGRGLEIESPNKLFDKPNPFETLDAIFNKVTQDFEIGNTYAFEVIKDKKGNIEAIYHMDGGRLRKHINGLGYWYSIAWTNVTTDGERAKNWNPKQVYLPRYKTGAKDMRSVFVFSKYRPGFEHYPLPDYVGALAAIETDVEISNFDLNNIKNGFSAGTMLNFNNGVPDEDKKADVIRDIKSKATGSNKAGEVFINFSVDKEHAGEILQMQDNQFQNKYESLQKRAQDTIFIGHKVTNPALFGVKIAGQLGNQSKDELNFAYEQMKETYIIHRQADLLYGLKFLLDDFNGKDNIVTVKELRPIMPDLVLSENTILQYVDKTSLGEYISKKYGIEVNPVIITPDTEVDKATETDKTQLRAQFSAVSYFEKVGKTYPDSVVLASNEVDTHGDKVKFAYNDTESFEFAAGLSKDLERILSVLNEFPTATTPQISRILDMREKMVTEGIGRLMDSGYIDTAKGKTTILPSGKSIIEKLPQRQSLKIVYSYELRDDAAPLLTESREFCIKMEQMSKSGKRWTREEIEGLANDMPETFISDIEDVWKYRGGWYTKPGTDVATPFCRHLWKQFIIVG